MMITTVRYIGASILSLLVVFSIVANLLVLIALIKGRQQLKNFSFFIITWQLLICNFIALVAYVLVAIPSLYANGPIYPEILTIVFSTFDRVSYRALNVFTTLLTINRIFIFFLPNINESVFKPSRLWIIIGIIWTLFIIYGVLSPTIGCYNTFDAVEKFVFRHVCYPETPVFFHELEKVIKWYNRYVPYVILVAYFAIFFEAKFKICGRLKYGLSSTDTSTMKAEYQILVQSVFLCGILLLENVAFANLPYLNFNEALKPWISMVTLWMMTILTCVHSVIIFVFNQRVRQLLKNIVQNKNDSHFSLRPQKPIVTIVVSKTK